MRTSRLRRMPDTSVGKPLRVRQMPAEGDPPAALVSPPAVLAPQRTGSPWKGWNLKSRLGKGVGGSVLRKCYQ
ncbi:hypothetical protein DP113_03430 [Brasilonema octagenarum UFV-E1]|uniref:Uncharacterized protein n=1 Tax=Brasilonema sennae CENA114 TaxID=415709 RepID=A0A856MBM3_9CYAN|nr:hypothetical protein [Brasilonema sennae]QDL07091.1 hypothetical protein DP114_03475 [Brasilonema sennae CENA114]QDL13455.1 hypothetical protein DP113_03430 [Brasilonema octagenarum UFV-E1]